jgi:Ni/Co efflux regulator RcnB
MATDAGVRPRRATDWRLKTAVRRRSFIQTRFHTLDPEPPGGATGDTAMKTLYSLMLALPLLAGSGAALADHDHGHDHGPDHHDWQEYRGHGHHDDRRYDGDRRYDSDRRYEHYRHWERGHRYGGPIYVVHDYGHYRLRPPPRGYHWVRGDAGSYLLVAIATGVILDIAMH